MVRPQLHKVTPQTPHPKPDTQTPSSRRWNLKPGNSSLRMSGSLHLEQSCCSHPRHRQHRHKHNKDSGAEGVFVFSIKDYGLFHGGVDPQEGGACSLKNLPSTPQQSSTRSARRCLLFGVLGFIHSLWCFDCTLSLITVLGI